MLEEVFASLLLEVRLWQDASWRVVIMAEVTKELPVTGLVIPDSGGLESLGDDTMERRKGKGGDFQMF